MTERDDLADKLALGELVSRYAWLVAQRQSAMIPDLFVEDGVFEGRGHTLHGREELKRFFGDQRKEVVPLVGNHLFELDGDRARGTSTLIGLDRCDGVHLFSGYYDDSFVRHDGRWLFSSRIFTTYFDMHASA